MCLFREDTGADLGCDSTPEPFVTKAGDTAQAAVITFTLVNPGHDVHVRGYAEDLAGNRSTNSPNRATADFTPPSAPAFIE